MVGLTVAKIQNKQVFANRVLRRNRSLCVMQTNLIAVVTFVALVVLAAIATTEARVLVDLSEISTTVG